MLWGVFTSSEKDAIENVKKKTWLHSWNYIQLYKSYQQAGFSTHPQSLSENLQSGGGGLGTSYTTSAFDIFP